MGTVAFLQNLSFQRWILKRTLNKMKPTGLILMRETIWMSNKCHIVSLAVEGAICAISSVNFG
jgi:hypothetical protein